jgi:hypothetical protein
VRTAPQPPTFETLTGEVEGIPTVFVVLAIPDDAPHVVREALARRRLATMTGECPCGARRPKLSRQARRRLARGEQFGEVSESFLIVEHEHGCPAGDVDTLRAWLNGRVVA